MLILFGLFTVKVVRYLSIITHSFAWLGILVILSVFLFMVDASHEPCLTALLLSAANHVVIFAFLFYLAYAARTNMACFLHAVRNNKALLFELL